MKPVCLYVRGEPGAGKKTVADALARDLGWPVVWLHDFDAVYRAVGRDPGPDLLDAVLQPVAEFLMNRGQSFLFVRPARGRESVRRVADPARAGGYRLVVVRLEAGYCELVRRVSGREKSEFRVGNAHELQRYLATRRLEEWPGEHVIRTDDLTPEQVAAQVKGLVS